MAIPLKVVQQSLPHHADTWQILCHAARSSIICDVAATALPPAHAWASWALSLFDWSWGVTKWQLYEGAVNAVRFSEFLQQLPSHSQLVLDNAVIHRATNVLKKQSLPTVSEVAETKHISLQYLPPYESSWALFQYYQNLYQSWASSHSWAAPYTYTGCS